MNLKAVGRVGDTLHDINKRDGITVLTNLHTLDTARTYCSRIVGMAAGKIVFDGAPTLLTDYPNHPPRKRRRSRPTLCRPRSPLAPGPRCAR